ncbi:MAG: carboxypeptidase-like regulatory domain-containing protein [Flavobacteriales bacterium]|nr:carboxypeptidase-like regulatory domain-containing protein [Flavobacteriales bacterium]
MLVLCASSMAQTTRITGTVSDAKSGEPLPFVNIAFVNSRIGTTSDIDGRFMLETFYATDSIRASFIGYLPATIKIIKDKEQVVAIGLEPSVSQLQEVIITPEERNPAFIILDRVIANKPANNREKLASYAYDAYNKVEFDLNNLSKKFTERKLFRAFDFVFDNIDSSDAKPSLPIFITETLSDIYFRRNPRSYKEVIRGTKVSGIQNESISQLLGDMYQNVNIYDNFLVIFGKNFVSPIADGGRNFYEYYLTDSTWIGNKWCYRMEFRPRREQELVFTGSMWIADTSYAVRHITAGIAKGANLNYVQGFWVDQEYDQVEHEVWMLTRDELVVDLSLARKNFQGFYGRRTATYRDFIIDRELDERYYKGAERVVVNRDTNSTTEAYWNEHRHVPLTEKEAGIYQMVDSVQQVPQFRTFVDIVNMLVTGYYTRGDLEYGPYFTFYSFNPVEGTRLRMGLRTSNSFSRQIELEGYLGYGFLDREFKGMIGGQAFITKEPRQLAGLYFRHDIEQLGQSQSAFRSDNILSSTFRRNPANKLTLVNEVRGTYEREWFTGFSNTVLLLHRDLFPRGDLLYLKPQQEQLVEVVKSITSFELGIGTRFAYREKYVSGEFRRVSLGTRFPVLEAYLGLGIPRVFGSEYAYTKLIGRIEQRVQMGALGWMRYRLEAGRLWGTLPYPLLILHTGNETFYYYDDAFNTMNFFEFLSDRYVAAFWEQHLDGFLFNRIPLLRKAKLREVLGAKAVIGSLDRKHLSELLLLPGMFSLYDGPFIEASAGVENILNVIRIDGVWRLRYTDHPNIALFAIRLKLHFDF